MAVQIHALGIPSIVADAGLKAISSEQVEHERNNGQSAVDLSFKERLPKSSSSVGK
jgi:hypothetical protein